MYLMAFDFLLSLLLLLLCCMISEYFNIINRSLRKNQFFICSRRFWCRYFLWIYAKYTRKIYNWVFELKNQINFVRKQIVFSNMNYESQHENGEGIKDIKWLWNEQIINHPLCFDLSLTCLTKIHQKNVRINIIVRKEKLYWIISVAQKTPSCHIKTFNKWFKYPQPLIENLHVVKMYIFY